MKANEIRPGTALEMNGKLFIVAKIGHVKPGKGPAYIQAKMRAVDGSGMKEQRFSGAEVVEGTNLDKREMEFLYDDGAGVEAPSWTSQDLRSDRSQQSPAR